MELLSQLHHLGGVARASVFRRAGFSDRELRAAVAEGWLIRPRSGWVALPNADPSLIDAAKCGVVLSCVTEARRLGLWSFEPAEQHVAARHQGSHARAPEAIVHWNRPLVQRVPGALVDPLENVLAIVSHCQPRESALVIIESALNKGLTTLSSLTALPISTKMQGLLEVCTPFSDSGLETLLKNRLRWLKVPIRAQVFILDHRVDALIGERLVVQIDGGHHVGAQRNEDNLHDAQLKLAGYHVLRFGYAQVVHHWEIVQDLIAGAVARGLHLARRPPPARGPVSRIAEM